MTIVNYQPKRTPPLYTTALPPDSFPLANNASATHKAITEHARGWMDMFNPNPLRVVVDFQDIFGYFYTYLPEVIIPDHHLVKGESFEERVVSLQPIDLILLALDSLMGIGVYAREQMVDFHDSMYEKIAQLEWSCCRLDQEPSNYQGLYPSNRVASSEQQQLSRQLLLDILEEQLIDSSNRFFENSDRSQTIAFTEDLVWKVHIATVIRIAKAVHCLALDRGMYHGEINHFDLGDPTRVDDDAFYTYVLNLSAPSLLGASP